MDMCVRSSAAVLAAFIATGLLAGCADADPSARSSSSVIGSTGVEASGGASAVPPSATDAPSPTEAPPAASALPPITVRRTGGFVGVEQTLAVRPDGGWSWAGADRGGAPGHGQLTRAQRGELARLAAEPALAEEARQKPAPPQCADGYDYVLSVGSMTVVWVDCDPVTPPTAVAITNLLAAATPL
jgi:hypothetical protein